MAASTVGWTVGLFWAAGVYVALSGFLVVVGAGIGAVVGMMQWLVLRQQVSQAGWWVVPAQRITGIIFEPRLSAREALQQAIDVVETQG